MTRAHGLDEQSITSFLARFQVDRESTNLPIYRVIWRHFLRKKCRSEYYRHVHI